jgi:3-vinyl bacteriochlorophyllide hydratase
MRKTIDTAVPPKILPGRQVQPDDPRPFDALNQELSISLNKICQVPLMDMAVRGTWSLPEFGVRRGVRRPLSPTRPLYTPEQRRRRDASAWTLVQGILAPVQFLIFLVSLCLVLWFLATGEGLLAATVSVVVKTIALYAIMITGSIWEREVFGRYLFADAFYWEDMVSMLVLALHTLYLGVLLTDALDARGQMLIALAAYASYVVNAGQFLLKLRAARKQGEGRALDAAHDGSGALGLAQ